MVQAIADQLRMLMGLGRDVGDVTAVQMAIRAVAIYAFTLALVRVGSKRFLGKGTAFDVIIGIMIGSVISRAINGSAPFVPTLVAGGALVGLHWLFAVLAFHTDWFGPLVKGEPVLLIKDGHPQRQGLRRGSLTPGDLAQALRLRGKDDDLTTVQLSYLERNGDISIILREQGPRILDVSVADGVQIVRIALE